VSSVTHADRPITTKSKLPMPSLLALFTAGFLGILNETVPAGLLPKMSASLGRSESVAGQTITVYALATALTVIPLNAALKKVGRRTLLVWALAVFAAANLVIAVENSFTVILTSRFAAGVAAGLIWSNIGESPHGWSRGTRGARRSRSRWPAHLRPSPWGCPQAPPWETPPAGTPPSA
jgi:MFS family permease